MDKILRPGEVAEWLGVSTRTVTKLIENGFLAATDISTGGRRPVWRIHSSEVEDFLRQRSTHRREPVTRCDAVDI